MNKKLNVLFNYETVHNTFGTLLKILFLNFVLFSLNVPVCTNIR